jgi:hypothetical protein
MATTSSIGTASRSYSTIASWLAAFTTGGWIGECYNDSEFTVTATIDFTAQSISTTNYATLTAAAGQSALDNNANPLKYDASKGVAIRRTNNYGYTINGSSAQGLTLSRLQVQGANAGAAIGSGASYCVMDRCLINGDGRAGDKSMISMNFPGPITNCVVINNHGFYACIRMDYAYGWHPVIANCTLVRPSDITPGDSFGAIIHRVGPAASIINTAAFNFPVFFTNLGASAPTGSNNATNLSSTGIGSGTGDKVSLTYTSQFVGTTSAAQDFRLKTGSALIGAGATDTTDIPAAIDIFGTARP